jgi:CIC family chloride channel protein
LNRFTRLKSKLNIVLAWSALLGILIGLVSAVFRTLVNQAIASRESLYLLLKGYPLAGWLIPSLLSGLMVQGSFWLMRRYALDANGSGIPQIEGALEKSLELNWKRVLPVKFFGGILSLGSGMVVGFEGPTIQIGGSIGQMIASFFKASWEQNKILIAAGAGAGVAAAFNAPLAGILLVTEEMRPSFKNWSTALHALMIACGFATITARIIYGQDAFLKITIFERVPLGSLWMFSILGIALGIIGYFFNSCLFWTLEWFGKQTGPAFKLRGLWVGCIIGLISLFYPVLTGGGEEAIIFAFNNRFTSWILLLICLARFVLVMFCYGSGAIGGIFAPMLAIASIFSLSLAKEFHHWFPFLLPYPAAFAVAGMGALVAATVRAPLTAMILTMELTDNYFLVLPLLITCTFSSMTAHLLGSPPIYSVLLKRTLDNRVKLKIS